MEESNEEPPQPNAAPYFENRSMGKLDHQPLCELILYLDSLSSNKEYELSRHEDWSACEILRRASFDNPQAAHWVEHYTSDHAKQERTFKVWRRFICDMWSLLEAKPSEHTYSS